MSDRTVIAKDAWGTIPDWLEALISACDKQGGSQNKVAKALGRAPAVISEVLRNRYKGDMADFESRVRDVFCEEQIICPALDIISTADCLHWRDEAAELKTGPHMVRMYRACRACPRYTKNEEGDEGDE